MKYMTVSEAAKKWNVSDRRVRFLCAQGRIRGIIQQGRRYLIPDDAEKPEDERVRRPKRSSSLSYNDFTRIDFLKNMMEESSSKRNRIKKNLSDEQELFDARFICSSNALHGSTLDQQETDQVLLGLVVYGHPLSEHLQAAGCKAALEYIRMCVRERKPLSQNTIRSLHTFVMMEEPFSAGKYKRVRVRINGSSASPVYLDLMEPRVNDLLNVNTQRKKAMHPIERIARFFLEFESIHPFENGNGRTGRLLVNLELLSSGYLPVVFDQKDAEVLNQAMKQYLQHQKADLMIKYLSEKEEEALESALNAARKHRTKKNAAPRETISAAVH